MRRLLGPALMTFVMLLILIGLGTWQIYREHWKEGILAQIAKAERDPPVPWSGVPGPFEKIAATGTLNAGRSARYAVEVRDTPQGRELGSFLIQPLERPGQVPLLVDRGWVPRHPPGPLAQPRGITTIVGYAHASSSPGVFTPPDDPARRVFYTLNAARIGAALGLPHVAPFILIALGPPPPQAYPAPARHLPRPPNNHLNYAITWYGLAIALVVIFVNWARRTLRDDRV